MTAQTDYIISSPNVDVDAHGRIRVGLLHLETMETVEWVCELSQKAAIDLATSLAQGVRRSIDRTQINTPGYYDSRRIVERMESPLGQAISALKKV